MAGQEGQELAGVALVGVERVLERRRSLARFSSQAVRSAIRRGSAMIRSSFTCLALEFAIPAANSEGPIVMELLIPAKCLSCFHHIHRR